MSNGGRRHRERQPINIGLLDIGSFSDCLPLAAAPLLLVLALAVCSGNRLPPPLEVYEDERAEGLSRADSGAHFSSSTNRPAA